MDRVHHNGNVPASPATSVKNRIYDRAIPVNYGYAENGHVTGEGRVDGRHQT